MAILCLAALLCMILCLPALAASDNAEQSLPTCHLQAASYFGGSGNEQGWPTTPSAIDADGNILFAIVTTSSNLASGGYDLSINGAADVLIVRMSADLTQVLSATYLGGSANEAPDAISVGDGGRVYVSGSTASANFPTTLGAYDITHSTAEDAFVAILSADLDSLLASTLIGGNGSDMECATAISTDGSIFAAFRTESTGLPISTGAVQSNLSPGGADYYIVRLNGSLTAALASTYFGGNGYEFRPKLAIDTDGDIYCTGSTFSSNLPTTPGAYDTQNNDGSLDAIIFHLSKTLDAVLASTYVGGNGTDWGYAIMLGDNEDVYLTGHVHSNWPTTPGCFDSTYGGGPEEGSDSYLCRLSSDLTTLKASTYLGGSGWDWGVDLARDSQGYIYVVGETSSPNFPTTSGAPDTTCCGGMEMFLAKFDSTMQTLQMSTFIGGPSNDRWPGVLVADSNHFYVIGYTESSNLQTTTGAYHASYSGGGDIYAAEYASNTYTVNEGQQLSFYDSHSSLVPSELLELVPQSVPVWGTMPYASGYSSIRTDFNGTPNYCAAGIYNLHIDHVVNGTTALTNDLNIAVNDVNRSPFFESPTLPSRKLLDVIPDTVLFWGSMQIYPTAHDSDCIQCGDDTLRMTYVANPFSPSIVFTDLGLGAASFLWTPSASERGNYTITFKATDRFGLNATRQMVAQVYVCGDANGDAITDISDVVYLIAYIFSGGSPPKPLDAGDANCDGAVDISDVVYLIAYIFSGGAAPCATCK